MNVRADVNGLTTKSRENNNLLFCLQYDTTLLGGLHYKGRRRSCRYSVGNDKVYNFDRLSYICIFTTLSIQIHHIVHPVLVPVAEVLISILGRVKSNMYTWKYHLLFLRLKGEYLGVGAPTIRPGVWIMCPHMTICLSRNNQSY